jgi:hypothetical protein
MHPSPPNFYPFWVFPGLNVLSIRTHPNPFPSERNRYNNAEFYVHFFQLKKLPEKIILKSDRTPSLLLQFLEVFGL